MNTKAFKYRVVPPGDQPDDKTLFVGDNLPVLRGIDSEKVDLIATDPPFNTGRKFEGQGLASQAAFVDRRAWNEHSDQWLAEIKEAALGSKSNNNIGGGAELGAPC